MKERTGGEGPPIFLAMSTIMLLRHGETHFNRAKRIQGQMDSPLTLIGIEQARAYGRTVATQIAANPGNWTIVTSPMGRCRQTTAILCEVAGLDFADVTIDPRLAEVNAGQWSGLRKTDLPAALMEGGGRAAWYFRSPNGEDWQALAARLAAWLAERRDGEKIIAVSHGVAGRVLRGLYAHQDPDQALAGESPQNAFFRLSEGQCERIACI